jgi:hypothetical protein
MRNRRNVRSWIVVQENLHITRKEVIQMKKREGLRSWMYIIFMAVTLMGLNMLLSQVPAQAAVDCATVTSSSTTDTDKDGFTDYQECNGITLADGTSFPGKSSQAAITVRLDPDTRDLFVILVPATPSSFPANPLEFVSKPVSQGGLGLNVHVITPAQAPNRVVSPSTQKAVRVTESLDVSNPNLLGISSPGTPNGLDLATVYTQRIKNSFTSILGTTPSQDLIDLYIKHTIAHEIGHMVGPLAPTGSSSYGGYHYKSGTNVIMDQSVYYKGTTFYIGTTYTSTDQTKTKLK